MTRAVGRRARRIAGGGVALALLLSMTVVATADAAPLPVDGAAPRTWHVAVDGDDDGTGVADDPFATWQRGIDAARPGDRVVIGGGRYEISGYRFAGVHIFRDGARGARITLQAEDPADRPVLSCAGLDNDDYLTCLHVDASWWDIRDIEVVRTPQPNPETPTAIFVEDADHVRLTSVASHHNRGTGISIAGDSAHDVLRSCDAYRNQDPGTEVDPYGNADGISLTGLTADAVGNRVVGCRSWWNSDDGFDLWESEAPVTIKRSWAFRNGYVPGTDEPAGNGQGFKLGRNDQGPRHVVSRSLAFANRSYGFDENSAGGPVRVINSTAFRNREGAFAMATPSRDVLRNNVALPADNALDDLVDDRWNSWTLPVSVSPADFRSVSWAGAAGPRRPDGSLPRLPFLRLRAGSDLVDAGVDIGLPYDGAAPDLGAYERR